MIFRIALRSLSAHPVRSLVLACGFGLGVGVMATLLGVGEVILDQARSPAIVGGGDVVIAGATGEVPSARWILSSAFRGKLSRRIAHASPTRRAPLYLVRNDPSTRSARSGQGRTVPIRASGGIPSLERAIGDPETASVDSWIDAASDRAWSSPDPGEALRALDRFHPIPDTPLRADSWAEWLYFNGRTGENRFYLTFLVGPKRATGKRAAGVRLQLDRAGQRSSFLETEDVDEAAILAGAPDLTIASSSVRLEGLRYRVTLDLPRVTGTLFIDAAVGRALPPLTIRGAGGWLSGYVVPVMSGALSGTLSLSEAGDPAPRQKLGASRATSRDATKVAGRAVMFDGGTGYHDHNWGFWKDVSWRWGQVHHGDLSLVYGRIYPPADAADAERIPGFLAALGPDGPVGYATNISIQETNDPATGKPRSIVVAGRSATLDLTMELAIEDAIVTPTGGGLFGSGPHARPPRVGPSGPDFLQLRARYRVRGNAGDRSIDFTAAGTAETFRGQ